jgi:hypothetical protein
MTLSSVMQRIIMLRRTTVSIMPFSIMTLSRIKFTMMTLRIMGIRLMTFNKMTLYIMANDIKHNYSPQNDN